VGNGGCEVSILLLMKSVDWSNIEITMRGFGYYKEVRAARI
jgi:hypothetical protein